MSLACSVAESWLSFLKDLSCLWGSSKQWLTPTSFLGRTAIWPSVTHTGASMDKESEGPLLQALASCLSSPSVYSLLGGSQGFAFRVCAIPFRPRYFVSCRYCGSFRDSSLLPLPNKCDMGEPGSPLSQHCLMFTTGLLLWVVPVGPPYPACLSGSLRTPLVF